MIIPGINLLVYVHSQDDIRYQSTRSWWDSLLEGEVTTGLGTHACCDEQESRRNKMPHR